MSFQWTISLFAGLAERFGQPAVTLHLESGEMPVLSLKQILSQQYPSLEALIQVSFVASNQEYAADGDIVRASDELALLPPVSGGERAADTAETDTAVPLFAVTDKPLSVEAVTANVIVPENGAAVTFTGTTRECNAAIALADASPLMLTPGIRCENGRLAPVTDADWIKVTEDMIAVARKTYQASQSRSQDAVSEATGDLSDACAACHRAYREVRPIGATPDPTDPSNKASRCQPRR